MKWVVIFVIYLRYLVGGAMVFSSIVKIKGERFTSNDGINEPIQSAMHLFETLYQSGVYWKFLGWSQLIAGMLLMTQFYSALGALLMLPITINIFVITISYFFAGTPIITFLLLLANLFLLVWHYEMFTLFFCTNKYSVTHRHIKNSGIEANKLWGYLGVILFATTIVYVVLFERTPVYWFLICIAIGFASLLYFFYNAKRTHI